MTKSVLFAGAALASAASLAHAYVCIGDAETRCTAAGAELTRERAVHAQERQDLRERERKLLATLEGERQKSPIRRAKLNVLRSEYDALQDRYAAGLADLERVQLKGDIAEASAEALRQRIDGMLQTLAHDQARHKEELRNLNISMLAEAEQHRAEQDALNMDLTTEKELRATEGTRYEQAIDAKTEYLETLAADSVALKIEMGKLHANLSKEQELRADETQRYEDGVASQAAAEETARKTYNKVIHFFCLCFCA